MFPVIHESERRSHRYGQIRRIRANRGGLPVDALDPNLVWELERLHEDGRDDEADEIMDMILARAELATRGSLDAVQREAVDRVIGSAELFLSLGR